MRWHREDCVFAGTELSSAASCLCNAAPMRDDEHDDEDAGAVGGVTVWDADEPDDPQPTRLRGAP